MCLTYCGCVLDDEDAPRTWWTHCGCVLDDEDVPRTCWTYCGCALDDEDAPRTCWTYCGCVLDDEDAPRTCWTHCGCVLDDEDAPRTRRTDCGCVLDSYYGLRMYSERVVRTVDASLTKRMHLGCNGDTSDVFWSLDHEDALRIRPGCYGVTPGCVLDDEDVWDAPSTSWTYFGCITQMQDTAGIWCKCVGSIVEILNVVDALR